MGVLRHRYHDERSIYVMFARLRVRVRACMHVIFTMILVPFAFVVAETTFIVVETTFVVAETTFFVAEMTFVVGPPNVTRAHILGKPLFTRYLDQKVGANFISLIKIKIYIG